MGILLLQMSMTICTLGKPWEDDPESIPVEEIIKIWREKKTKGRYTNKVLWSLQSLQAHEKIVEASIFEMQAEGLVEADDIPTASVLR